MIEYRRVFYSLKIINFKKDNFDVVWLKGEGGDVIPGLPGQQGIQGERGRPGPIIDANGREIITVKGEQVAQITETFTFVADF